MIITLQNEFLSVTISSHGAEIISVKDSNQIEYMWQADPEVWARHAPILFPYVGKLQHDTLRVKDKALTGFKQHGFARDSEFEILEQGTDFVTFGLNNQLINLPFPFQFELSVTYSLKANYVSVGFEVLNTGNESMPFSLGYHPAFAIEAGGLNEYYLQFDKSETSKRLILEDGLIGDSQGFLIEQKIIELGRELFDRDALILDTINSHSITLIHETQGKVVCISGLASWPQLGIWTMQKDSARFICLEPWHGVADSKGEQTEFSNKKSIVLLSSQQTWKNKLDIEFCEIR